MRRSTSLPRAIIVTVALVLAGCQAAGQSPSVSEPRSPEASTAIASAVEPTPTLPAVMPPPTDIPTDGTCEEGHSCLGLLEAGKAYSTIAFTPTIAFTMPEGGWENIGESGGTFALLPIASPGDSIAFFRDPVARGADSAGVGSSVEELAAWLAANPLLDVTPPTPVTVGGLSGLVMDFTIADGAETNSRGCPVQVCVALFTGEDAGEHKSWEWDWGSAGPEVQRIYLLTASDGVVAIFVDSLNGTTFDSLSAKADAILASVTFG